MTTAPRGPDKKIRTAPGAELAANYADIARVRSLTAENWKRATTDGKPSVLNGGGSMNERVALLSIHRFYRPVAVDYDDIIPVYILPRVRQFSLVSVDYRTALIRRLF